MAEAMILPEERGGTARLALAIQVLTDADGEAGEVSAADGATGQSANGAAEPRRQDCGTEARQRDLRKRKSPRKAGFFLNFTL
jgi:hypothetical protein